MAEPPRHHPISEETTLSTLTDAQLLAWLTGVYAQWRQVPRVLAELTDRGLSFRTIRTETGLPRSTAHAMTTRYKARTAPSTPPESSSDPTGFDATASS